MVYSDNLVSYTAAFIVVGFVWPRLETGLVVKGDALIVTTVEACTTVRFLHGGAGTPCQVSIAANLVHGRGCSEVLINVGVSC